MTITENNAINISKVLTEALPYIRKFNNKVVVIKYGGNAMENKILKKKLCKRFSSYENCWYPSNFNSWWRSSN